MEDETKSFLTHDNSSSIKQPYDSNTWLKRWRKGDKIFKGIFSAGVTPKIQRSVKRVKVESPQILFENDDNISDPKYGINPFIETTPKCGSKSDSNSSPENTINNMYLSPKATQKPKHFASPTPIKIEEVPIIHITHLTVFLYRRSIAMMMLILRILRTRGLQRDF